MDRAHFLAAVRASERQIADASVILAWFTVTDFTEDATREAMLRRARLLRRVTDDLIKVLGDKGE